jgi:peptidoglycan/LPS O-acetylase OafA/YrhL
MAFRIFSTGWRFAFSCGGSAVLIFFVLSGAVLAASLQRGEHFDSTTVTHFLIRRVLRIYPALVVSILAYGVASHISVRAIFAEPFTVRQIVMICLLLGREVNGATYTLQVEILMVPAILLVVCLQRIYGEIAGVLFLIFAILCVFQGTPFDLEILNTPLTAFALGMLVPTKIAKDAVAALPASSWAVFVALMVAARFTEPFSPVATLMLIYVLAFGAVAVLYHADIPSYVLDRSLTRFLGRIGYSVYLVHVVVIYELFRPIEALVGADWISKHHLVFGLGFSAVALAIIVPLSALSEAYVERPFIRMARDLRRGLVRPVASA